MNPIDISIAVKVVPRQYELFLTTVKEPWPGPGCKTCQCGEHFAAFFNNPHEEEATAFADAIKRHLGSAMMDGNAIRKPFSEPVVVHAVIDVPRPQNHHVSSDPLRELKADADSYIRGGWPDVIRCLDAIAPALVGYAIHSRNQIARVQCTKRYADKWGLHVTVRPARISDVDPDCNQMELF
jgi:hypothetical protein